MMIFTYMKKHFNGENFTSTDMEVTIHYKDKDNLVIPISTVEEWYETVRADIELQEQKDAKVKEIGQHIYDSYPEIKQNQDKSYLIVNKDIVTALTEVTQDELSTELVLEAMHYLEEGSRLSSYIANKPSNLKNRYKRLYKVSIRLAWCDYCVREGKLALEQNRLPNYPEFPNFKG